MGGASRLRDAVDAAGSRLEISVRELRDCFGISRLTVAGRERIARELGAKGLRIEPPLARLGLEDRVTIVDKRPRPVPTADDLEPVPSTTYEAWATPRRPFWTNRRRAVVAGAAVGLLVILLSAVFASNAGTEAPDAGSIPSPPAAVDTASTQGRAELLATLRQVDAAAAQDDPDSARRLLRSIDADALMGDADLAERARILQHRILLTESYLEATALAESGRYRDARERMLAIIPFRDAGVRARQYGVLIAKDLVAQARAEYPSDTGRALELLDEAEEIAPGLSEIATVRAEATGG